MLRLVLASILVVLISCGGEKGVEKSATPVVVSKVLRQDVPREAEFVGQTKGSVDAEIRARVEGLIQEIHFEEGKAVNKDQLLYVIDEAPYKAKLAEANAKLAEAESTHTKAVADLKRIRPLAEMKAVSMRTLDASVASEASAKASVEAAKANVESAQIELSYCKIVAPISGTIGLTKAKIGEFVGRAPNPVVLNTVSQLDPINVRFPVGEKEYLSVAKAKIKEGTSEQEAPKRELRLELADGSEYPHTGEVTSVDSQLDPTTGTLMVEATFPNAQKLIRPGQFAKIKVVLETRKAALVIPRSALYEMQGQSRVYLVNKDNLLESRVVGVEESKDIAIVNKGLAEGDVVVAEGLQRLNSGLLVSVKE